MATIPNPPRTLQEIYKGMREMARNMIPEASLEPGSVFSTLLEVMAHQIYLTEEMMMKITLPQPTEGKTITIKANECLKFIPITISIGGETIGDCDHDWISYEGFSESYKYCAHCDEKRK